MEIFTVGHSNYSLEKFLGMLNKYNINCVVDIRGTPYSKYNTQYNKEAIKESLKDNGFIYIYMGKEFAAQRNNKLLYNKEGYADFEKVVHDKDFLDGIKRLEEGCNKGYKIALMGAKQDPINDHRCILVGRALVNHGFNVKYILDDESITYQSNLEEKLIEKYYSDRNQLTFDSLLGNTISKEEMINESYRKANKEIGYRVENI